MQTSGRSCDTIAPMPTDSAIKDQDLQDLEEIARAKGEIQAVDLSGLMELVWRIRRMFDLDADPMALGDVFADDPSVYQWSANRALPKFFNL